MLNAIRMDLYRMLKIKSTWILLIVLVVTTFLSVLMINVAVVLIDYASSTDNELASEIGEEFSYGFEIGYSSAADMMGDETVPSAEEVISNPEMLLTADSLCVAEGTGATYLILMTIFMVLFVNGESKSGFLKSISNHVPSKGVLIVSKMLCALIFDIIMVVIGTATIYLSLLIFSGTDSFTDFSKTLFVSGMFILINISFAALVMLITVLTRSSSGGMVTGLIIATGFSSLLIKVIDWAISEISGSDSFTISDYILSTSNMQISATMEQQDIIRTIVVAVVWMVVSFVGSILLYSKRDIK